MIVMKINTCHISQIPTNIYKEIIGTENYFVIRPFISEYALLHWNKIKICYYFEF